MLLLRPLISSVRISLGLILSVVTCARTLSSHSPPPLSLQLMASPSRVVACILTRSQRTTPTQMLYSRVLSNLKLTMPRGCMRGSREVNCRCFSSLRRQVRRCLLSSKECEGSLPAFMSSLKRKRLIPWMALCFSMAGSQPLSSSKLMICTGTLCSSQIIEDCSAQLRLGSSDSIYDSLASFITLSSYSSAVRLPVCCWYFCFSSRSAFSCSCSCRIQWLWRSLAPRSIRSSWIYSCSGVRQRSASTSACHSSISSVSKQVCSASQSWKRQQRTFVPTCRPILRPT